MKQMIMSLGTVGALVMAISLLSPSSAFAIKCFGCYDGPGGKEICKSVEVEGSTCDVIGFLLAVAKQDAKKKSDINQCLNRVAKRSDMKLVAKPAGRMKTRTAKTR